MVRPVQQHIKELEAEALGRLIRAYMEQEDVPSYNAFAKMAGIQGQRSMLHQHLKALKPISVEAAKQYATQIGCQVAAFSPRLAALLGEPKQIDAYDASGNIAKFAREPSPRERAIQDLIRIADDMSDFDLGELIGRAKEISARHHGAKANAVK